MVGDLLRQTGYRCHVAHTATEALKQIAQTQFTLALVDVRLPGESGIDLVDSIVRRSPGVAVVMLTGMDDPGLAQEALRRGACGYLIKPFRATELLVTVANARHQRSMELQHEAFEQVLRQQVQDQAAALKDALEQLDRNVRAEMAVETEARFRGLLEAGPDAIVVVDEGGVIMLANAVAERLFGYEREDMEGQTIEMLLPESIRDVHPVRREQYLQDPRPRQMGRGMALTARRADGSEFPVEVLLSAVKTSDGLLISAAVRDITERLKAQAEQEELRLLAERERMQSRLLQAQRLESLGQLAGGVAHDFNNLLSAIINYSDFVQDHLSSALEDRAGPDWPGLMADVGEIKKAAHQGSGLTKRLLAFARREEVHPTLFVINEVISDVRHLLRRTIGEHIELTTSLCAGLHPIKADRGQIEQVIMNLAVNARDAMSEGGTLTITTENVDLERSDVAARPGVEPGPYVLVKVTDTGTGMSPEVMARVFEPFYSTKPTGSGTGLGLATAYGIIQQAGGQIEIASTEGKGTTFSVLLPASATTESPVAKSEVAPSGETGSGMILVVDDQHAIRTIVERLLQRNGYQVVTASSGQAALALLDEVGPIDLVITDLVMPQQIGTEVARLVSERRPGVPTIYMTGSPEVLAGSRLPPGAMVLEKPFNEQGLIASVRQVLVGGSGRDSDRSDSDRPDSDRPDGSTQLD